MAGAGTKQAGASLFPDIPTAVLFNFPFDGKEDRDENTPAPVTIARPTATGRGRAAHCGLLSTESLKGEKLGWNKMLSGGGECAHLSDL